MEKEKKTLNHLVFISIVGKKRINDVWASFFFFGYVERKIFVLFEFWQIQICLLFLFYNLARFPNCYSYNPLINYQHGGEMRIGSLDVIEIVIWFIIQLVWLWDITQSRNNMVTTNWLAFKALNEKQSKNISS